VAQLVGIIRRLRPQIVVTFEPNGGYGHPDHIAAHHHTVAAFHAAGDPARYSDQGSPLRPAPRHGSGQVSVQAWQPARLFYTAIPRSFFPEMRDRLDAMGADTSEFARFEESGAGWPDDQVHVTLDVSGTIEAKWAALQCHRTQFGPDNFFRRLPENMLKEMMSREHFALAWPEPAPGLRLPGLFAELCVEEKNGTGR